MTTDDTRFSGLTSSAAYKVPVRVATTGPITLSGLQTVDGVALASKDRVLVKDQADPIENGIYNASTTGWQRAKDFNGSRDAVQGTQIWVNQGTANGENFFRVDTVDPFRIGFDEIEFTVSPGAGTQGPQGDQGDDGLSAYQVAVNNGFVGNEAAWLASLKGAKGDTGNDGNDGNDGADGDSAYAIAINNGFVGSQIEWLVSLKGNTGTKGDKGDQGNSITGAKGDKGDKGLNFRGVWATTTDYAVDDVVYDQGSSYVCIFANTAGSGNRPGTVGGAGTWELLAVRGNDGAQGEKGDPGTQGEKGDPGTEWRGEWVTATNYSTDDLVRAVDGGVYIAITGHTSGAGSEPGIGVNWQDYWELFAAGGNASGALLAALNLSDLDDASVARTNIGLAIGTDVQAYDAELAALAGLTSAADRLPYFTGSGTAALATFTAGGRALVNSAGTADTFPYFSASNTVTLQSITTFGRSLIDDADATTARSTLGLVIGTNVQAYDAELAALAGLTSAANTGFYFSGSGTAATYSLTAGGRALGGVAGTADTFPYFSASNTVTLQSITAGGRALGALTYAADRIGYTTSASAAAVTPLTSFGRSLIDDADAATAQTTLGLVIGTNVQAYDAELAALAGLTSAANKIPYFTGSGTAALLDFSTSTSLGASNTTIPSQGAIKSYVDTAVAAGIADGDKGDVTVSSSGTVWTIDNLAVSYAKIQNVSATDRLLGRSTAGAGVIEEIPLTAAGRALIDDADATAQRATLGLVIGTNVQAYDAELAAIAGLTSAANTGFYFSGSGTAATYSLTAGGRALGGITGTSGAMIYYSGAQVAAEVTTSTGGRALLNAAGTANTFPYYSASNTVSLQAITAGGRALGALTYAADQIGYATSASAAAVTSLTTFGRSLIDDADATTARATLGLVIGTNVQAYDAELAALAGLTSAADKGIYFTGAGTAGTYDLTSFARTLLDDADAATARTTLGITDGGLVLLSVATASASSALNFTSGIDGTYDQYLLMFDNVLPTTDAVTMYMVISTDGGSTWINTGSTYIYERESVAIGDLAVQIETSSASDNMTFRPSATRTLDNASTSGISGFVLCTLVTGKRPSFVFELTGHKDNDSNLCTMRGSFKQTGTTKPNALSVLMSSGTIASGVVRLYGVKRV